MKIFSKLLIVTSSLLIFSLLLVGIFSFTSTKNTLEKKVGNEERTSAETMIKIIDRLLYERYLNIRTIGESLVITWAVNGKIPLSEGEKRVKNFFNSTGPWDQLMVMDATGKVLICTLGTKAEDITKEPEINAGFQAAIKGNEYYSDLVLSTETGRPTMVFAFPIRNSEAIGNPVIGVVVGEYSWGAVNEIISDIALPQIVRLYNKDGVLIASNDAAAEHKLFKESFKDHSAIQSALKGEEGYVVGPGIGSAQESLIAYVTEDGYLGFLGNSWVLSIETPTSIAFAAATSAAWQAVFTIGFIFLVSILLLGFIFNVGFVRPLVGLTAVVGEIGEGNLARRVPVASKDEIGILGGVVNQMAENLRENRTQLEKYSKGLEKMVAEKTSELGLKIKELSESQLILRSLAEDIQEEKESVEIKIKERTGELSEEKGKLMSLIESVKLGVVMVDLGFNIILSNQAAKNILGAPFSKSLVFDDFQKKIRGVAKIPRALDYYIRAGESLDIDDMEIGNKYFRFFMSPVHDVVKKVSIGAVIILEDISEQKKLDKMRTEIVAITSHQLRTPSAVIRGNLEMVLEGDVGKVTKEQKEVLNQAYLGNERMIRLINDLMDVAQIEEGKFKVVSEPSQLEDLAVEVISEAQPLAKGKHVFLSFVSPAAPLPKVKIDRLRIKQAFQNLIDNAVKYSRLDSEGKVTLEIQKEKESLKVIFKDNGIGIPKDEQEKIFQRFVRGSNATQLDPGGGTGLGLYVARAIIEQSGGKIWFVSEEGKGTVFYVTLPL
jgi:two-component system phosphate regulon sensor histidine kinase PhoR